MKKYTIPFSVVGSDGFELLEATCQYIDIVDDGGFWLADFSTNCRVLSNGDVLELTVTPEQETALRLRFGDKITELV